jgi:hypothetical protein
VPLVSLEVIRSTWNAMASWSPAHADRAAKRFVERQPVVNAAVLALTEDAGEQAASMALYCACAIAECYETVRRRALPRVRERIMDEALQDMERWGRDLENMDEQLFARRALYGRDHRQPYLVAELIRYLMDAADDGDFDGKDLGMIFSVLLAVIRAFDGVTTPARRVPSMEQVLRELTGRPLPCLHRSSPCPCGSGRRYRECCLKKKSLPSPRSRAPLH